MSIELPLSWALGWVLGTWQGPRKAQNGTKHPAAVEFAMLFASLAS